MSVVPERGRPTTKIGSGAGQPLPDAPLEDVADRVRDAADALLAERTYICATL